MDAILALEDGRVFHGLSLGASGSATGEVVFNTGMTGYQEILTDPSYRGQIVTLTVPHVGNTGVNEDDPESERVQVSGLLMRDESVLAASWRSRTTLSEYLRAHDVVGLAGLDTRALTRHLRTGGVLRGCVSAGDLGADEAVAAARNAPRVEDLDLVGEVTRPEDEWWREESSPLLGEDSGRVDEGRPEMVAIDYGVKRNILRRLAGSGFSVRVVPANTSARDILAMRPDALFLSNGPGDPASCTRLTEELRALIGRVPIFGICLGHQLSALALGASTFKLRFGHRGTNHPVRDERTGRVMITSQNHGYAVDPKGLPSDARVTHVSLYDGTVEGFVHEDARLTTVQFHPEAAPGPHDAWPLFESFAASVIRDEGEGAREV